MPVAIHPTAIIDKQAHVPASADVGPYAVIEGPVRLGERVKVYAHAFVCGWTEIGDDCEIHPHTTIGHLPQDFHFTGERSYCRIGAGTILREGVSVHCGSQPESETCIGAQCFLMGNSHVAHNSILGDHVKMMNGVLLAGHVEVGDHAILSGNLAVHQFARIGGYAMVSGVNRISSDILPFMTIGNHGLCVGYNSIGLRRSGQFTKAEIDEVRRAYRTLYRTEHTFSRAMETLRGQVRERTGKEILAFYDAKGKRPFVKGPDWKSRPLADSDGTG